MFVFVVAVEHLFLVFLSIGENAVPANVFNALLIEYLRYFQHVAVVFEIQEKTTSGVDEVDGEVGGDRFSGFLD